MDIRSNGHERKVAVGVVRCPGDLNARHMVQMRNRLSRLTNQNRKFLLLDLKRARHVDLAGLGILVDRIQKLRREHGDIRLFNLRPEVSNMLRMIGVAGVIASYPTEEEARRSFRVA